MAKKAISQRVVDGFSRVYSGNQPKCLDTASFMSIYAKLRKTDRQLKRAMEDYERGIKGEKARPSLCPEVVHDFVDNLMGAWIACLIGTVRIAIFCLAWFVLIQLVIYGVGSL